MFIKLTANDRSVHLGPLKMAQLVKIPFIVFRLARLISSTKLAVKIWYTHSLALSYEPFICQEILILEEL